MYCSNCGAEIVRKARFCPKCGHAVEGGMAAGVADGSPTRGQEPSGPLPRPANDRGVPKSAGSGLQGSLDGGKSRRGIIILVASILFLAIVAVAVAPKFDMPSSRFSIEGKWKNVGTDTYGQIMQGSIVVFDGTNCNVVSPADTYALVRRGSSYRLDCTTFLFANTLSFDVRVIDNNNIELKNSGKTIRLTRVGT